MKTYILENKEFVNKFLTKEIPELKVTNSKGTFLVWINYENLNINECKLKRWFVELSWIEVSLGNEFFTDKPFFGMNIALPKLLLQESLYKIKKGLILLKKENFYYE